MLSVRGNNLHPVEHSAKIALIKRLISGFRGLVFWCPFSRICSANPLAPSEFSRSGIGYIKKSESDLNEYVIKTIQK
jgi:hypothetical protein